MTKRAIIAWLKRPLYRFARSIVARGLRPETAALLAVSRSRTAEDRSQREAAEWILRAALPQGPADLLLARDRHDALLEKPLSAASVEWAHWIARDCIARDVQGSLQMPLVKSINSDDNTAPFFNGENTKVMQGSIVSPDSNIGANTYIGFNCHITKTNIGRYVSVADGVLIGPGEHFLDQVSTSSLFYDEPYEKLTRADCVIGHDVWIGASCVIRRGVNVGIGAVIGANSFVNHDVEPFAIMAGSPARCIGYRFPADKIKAVLRSAWWELPASEARTRIQAIATELKL
ncbi:CatB-related O-acetyltransferase [Devosia sp. Leaf64]|uniref:CatB-related O-acetyltransferase n=1 Tax=Devosia sp. Leaf64 TaxID=1736229 RepID=UPI00071415A8|nr:CatB-related O-acetyltransferase [Devosia sp. Leaf64]KQN74822.1 hypothetical protein ASE94_00330 [Devosia sp. Leaf64]